MAVTTQAKRTRARLIDAAIARFATDGFEGATLRDIAADAGVSLGLIRHHFGSKADLRATCDVSVIDAVLTTRDPHTTPERIAAVLAGDASAEGAPPYGAYLRRLVLGNDEAADRAFDTLMAATVALLERRRDAGDLRSDVDPARLAPVLTVYGLAPLVLPRQLARGLGRSRLDGDALADAAAALAPVLDGALGSTDPAAPRPARTRPRR